MVAASPDLAGLARRDLLAVGIDALGLGVGDRLATGRGDRLVVVAELAGGDGAGALGQAIGGDDVAEAELGPHAVDELDRNGGAAGNRETE